MWLGLGLVVLAVLFVIVGIFSGGVFTIVLVPLAVIGVLAGVVTLMSARAAGIRQTLTEPPHTPPAGPAPRGTAPAGDVSVTPEQYTDARQRSQ
ncbi:MAG TPA: hypothetical protein VFN36_05760 [Solirubrobacteraceae bacterium]|nr:hypothetical protein [Solirubrobacteraceae bacterium]